VVDLLLSEEERLLQKTVREFASRDLEPRSRELDEKEEFSWEIWRGMANLGLTGIGIDPIYGGTGGGYRKQAIAVEEVARGDAAASLTLIAHLSLATHTINQYGNEEQKVRYLSPLARGEKLAAWALTEPGAGSDAAALQTTATLTDGMYYLNGSKTFITNADIADYIVVFANQDRRLSSLGISSFVLERGAPGFESRKQQGKMGMRGSTTGELLFQNTPVPLANRLGVEGRGFRYAMEILDSSRIIVAAQCVGIAQAALEAALKYSRECQSSGQPIAQHQAVQFLLADMATEIHASRLAVLHAATLKDQCLPFASQASMAKLLASETAVRVTSNAVQIHGDYGYFDDAPVSRYFRDARATTIYEGTSEIQRLAIARQILMDHTP
jgi:alkylation response protein AidB-like acyl-CoA dehydrogenase